MSYRIAKLACLVSLSRLASVSRHWYSRIQPTAARGACELENDDERSQASHVTAPVITARRPWFIFRSKMPAIALKNNPRSQSLV